MARPTLEQYYKYLEGAPRTFGWGALLVYDRKKANLLLMQEHIERAGRKAWIKPLTADMATESGKFSQLSNFTFGPPVLSFENSSIGSSKATVSMPVVDGKLTEWSQEPGAQWPTLVGISHLDPLTAPRVKMNINLMEGKGGVVDGDGRVYLDLSDSTAYYFEVSQWEELNIKLGQLIEAEFKNPDRGKQIWELNKLAPVDNLLNPTTFRVRTHSLGKAGNSVASTNQADLEEGAIIVGVAFNDDPNGDFPGGDADMPYLLPAREAGGSYSMNVVLSNEVWLKQVFSTLLGAMTDVVSSGFEYKRDANGFIVGGTGCRIRCQAKKHLLKVSGGPIKGTTWSAIIAPEGAVGAYEFTVDDDGIHVDWKSEDSIGVLERDMAGAGSDVVCWPVLKSDLGAEMTIKLDKTGSVLALVRGGLRLRGDVWLEGWDSDVFDKYQEYVPATKDEIWAALARASGSFANRVEVVDLLRLNGLLFRNGQRSVMDTLSVPGDVSMLGDLAPILTAFAIDPIEITLLAGATHPLSLTPEPQPDEEVKWEVKALPGDPENPEGPEQLGEVVNDIYQAPKADAIASTFRQVIITATVGETSSSALFTVVPKSVSVRPMLLNALYSTSDQPQRYVLEGGSVDSELVWATGAGFKGELRDPIEDEYVELKIPRDKQVKVYVAPLRDPTTGPELGTFMQLDQVHVTRGSRTETIDITVLWKPTSATLRVKAQEGGALKLVLTVQPWGEEEQDLSPAKTQWYVAKGKGVVDKYTGIYRPGPDEGDYVIIAGVGPDSGQWNYAVLPIPYTPEEEQAFHEVNQAINRKNANAPHTEEQTEAMEVLKKAFNNSSAART